MGSILDGESFVLISPSGKTRTSYFREGDDFYLESERGMSNKSVKTGGIRKQLRTWTLEKNVAPSPEPVAPVVSAILSSSQTSTPSIQNTNEQNLLRLQQLEEEERDALEDKPVAPATPDPVPLPVNATELQKEVKRMKFELKQAQKGRALTENPLHRGKNVDKLSPASMQGRLKDRLKKAELTSDAQKSGIADENKDSSSDKRIAFAETVGENQSVTLVSADEKEDLVLTKRADKWFDSNGKGVSDDVIQEKLRQGWRLLSEEENVERAFGWTAQAKETQAIDVQIRALYNKKKDASGKEIEMGKLVELRQAYAEAEYRNVGVWQRLREKLGVRKKESDSVPEREAYHLALQKLIDLKIQRLKMQADLSPEDLKVKMAETLQFFGTESKIKLYEAWTQATMKREGRFAKAVGLCEDFGNQYNKLKLWQKLGLGALALGTSVVTGGGAMATGMLVARRAAAGFGSFAMFEGVLEKISQKMASNTMENKAGEAMIGLEKKEGAEARLNHLMDILKSEMSDGNLRQELHDRAKGKTLRTISAAVLSLGMMLGIPALGDYLKDTYFGAEVAENTADATKEAVATAKAVAEDGAPASGTIVQEQLEKAFQAGADGHVDMAPAPSGVATETVKVVTEAPIPADYEIVKGDTTWHILDGYLTDHDPNFSGMSEGQQTHAIDALKDKLKLLTPAQLKEAGFSSGNIDKLRIGDTIHLDRLIDTVDADKAIENAGHISAAAQHAIEQNNEKIAEWAAAHPGVPINEVTIENQILHPHTGVAGDVAHVRGVVPVDPVSSVDDSTATSLQEQLRAANAKIDMLHQGYEELKHLPRAENWSTQIFGIAPNESLGASTKTFEQIKDIRIADIRSDLHLIHENKAIYADAQEIKGVTGERTGLLGWQLTSFSDFSNSEKSALKLSTYLRSLPWDMQNKVTLGDYIKHVTPLVKQGDRLGASGLFTTSM